MPSHIYKQQPQNEITRIELELTSVCNLKCPLCMRERMQLPKKNSFRPIGEVIDQLDQYTSLRYVTLAGAIAEPTTYPHLFDLLLYLKRRGVEISLYINGDTHTDAYYTKLGAIFNGCDGYVYFTICGSTQELHEQYRVGSSLATVLRRLDIVNRFSGNRGMLTWIVFNYNQDDFLDNFREFQQQYNTEYFYTLPIDEHFQTQSPIHLPLDQRQQYIRFIDRTDMPESCPANENNFIQIDYTGNTHPCTLHRLYGESRCFECSTKNKQMLRRNQIFNVAEAESDTSEFPLRLHTNDSEKIRNRRN